MAGVEATGAWVAPGEEMAMKMRWMAAMALALASLPLVAQNQSQTKSFGVASIEGSPATPSVNRTLACPVDLRARHLAYTDMIRAGEATPKGPGQRLQLTLGSAAARQIVRATMTVHGLTLNSNGHVWRTSPRQGVSSDAVRTLTVPFSKGANGVATAEVWVAGFTAVEAIDLKSVVYTDGSKWSLADGATCRIVPDPFMLVGQ